MSVVSPQVKKRLEEHLKSVANNDALFAETLKKPNKNIEDCITYILNEVKKKGYNWLEDDEVFGMAIHYYDEDNIDIGKKITGKVVSGYQKEIKSPEKPKPMLTQKPVKTKKETSNPGVQTSLF